MVAALLAQPRVISFVAVEVETMQRQRRPLRLELCTRPIHSAPLSCMLAVANMAKIPAILNRRPISELAGPELPLNVPMRTTVSRRIEEGALQRCHRSVNGALAPARDTREGVLGGRAKSGTIGR